MVWIAEYDQSFSGDFCAVSVREVGTTSEMGCN